VRFFFYQDTRTLHYSEKVEYKPQFRN